MVRQHGAILEHLKPLEPLDLASCETVSHIAAGMARCSFGARMVGDAADTLTEWTTTNPKPMVIYDGEAGPANALYGLLAPLCRGKRGWFKGLFTSDGFARSGLRAERALVVGPIPERLQNRVFGNIGRAICVNNQGQCRPGQICEGYVRDAVFADPRAIIPILYYAVRERRDDAPCPIEELMTELKRYGGQAGELVRGAETLAAMLENRDCTVMLTVSGAMTVAKMQLLIVELIETGRVAYVSTTGALMAHGLIEGSGCQHYKHDPRFSDEELAAQKLNRVFDTIEPEQNFDHIAELVRQTLSSYPGGAVTSSIEFHRRLGELLAAQYPDQRAILSSAYRHNVPVSTPAFSDSELANDVFVFNAEQARKGKYRIIFDQERDTGELLQVAALAKRLGIFTIGGGVPRNNTQNVAPLIELFNKRLMAQFPEHGFGYGCRIDPAPAYLGHLSGCTYSEGRSWRKIAPGGIFAQVLMDATIAWPFVQKWALERIRR